VAILRLEPLGDCRKATMWRFPHAEYAACNAAAASNLQDVFAVELAHPTPPTASEKYLL
jgi:hypothetical protein